MNVEIGAEAAQFPEKEYKNVIFLAVFRPTTPFHRSSANYSVPCSDSFGNFLSQ